MTLGAAKACSGHSQESSALRRQQLLWRQQLPWVIVASVQQSTPTMPEKKEANAHGQPREGQPLLYRRRHQVTPRQPQAAPQVTWTNHTLHSGGTRPQRLSVSDLPPLHGPKLPLAPLCQLNPEMQRAASARVKLPHLPAAAAPRFSPRGAALAVGPMARGQQEMVPPSPRGTLAAGRAWETPSQARRAKGSAARQGHGLPPVEPARGMQIRPGTHAAWKHLEHSETEELIQVQVGHGGNTCSDLFAGLGPYLRENRSVKSTLRTPKWLSARQEVQGISWPAKQIADCKQLCPEDDEDLMRRLREKREELEQLEDKVYEEMFRAIFSSLDDNDRPMRSKSSLSDASSFTLEPAAGPSAPHNTCSLTNDAAEETQTCSELVSLDQLLAELCPVSDNSLSCNALVKDSAGETDNNTGIAHPDLLAGLCSVSGNSPSCAFLDEHVEMCEEEELYDGATAGQSHSEPDSPLSLSMQEEEAEPPASPIDSDPCIEHHSQPLPTALLKDPNMSVGCAVPADAVDEDDAADIDVGCARAAPPQENPVGMSRRQGRARCLPSPWHAVFLPAPLAVQPSRSPRPHGDGAPWPRGPGGLCAAFSPSAASAGSRSSEPGASTGTVTKDASGLTLGTLSSQGQRLVPEATAPGR
nr:uncharacterized protein LOC121469277 [Taeniopygia guttata]